MRNSNFRINLISVLLAVAGLVILYINPGNAINRTLFLVSTSFASTIHLLKKKQAPGIPRIRRKEYAAWLAGIVLSGGVTVYLLMFSAYKHHAVAAAMVIATLALVVLFIIRIRRDASRLEKNTEESPQ